MLDIDYKSDSWVNGSIKKWIKVQIQYRYTHVCNCIIHVYCIHSDIQEHDNENISIYNLKIWKSSLRISSRLPLVPLQAKMLQKIKDRAFWYQLVHVHKTQQPNNWTSFNIISISWRW